MDRLARPNVEVVTRMSVDGLILPGYLGLELLHDGRTHAVYRARVAASSKPVIVKTGSGGISPTRASLEREAAILEQLTVSGVPRLHALELRGSRPALVFEDLGGETLARLISMNSLDLERRLRIALNLSRVLASVHESRIIHRDINPNNVLVDDRFSVALIDFGLAESFDGQGQTVGRRLEGTPAYLSPEQTGRTGRLVDVRSDLYSLGATLYELFTRRVPFAFDDPLKVVHAHIAIQPRSPAELNPSLPSSLTEILLKLLAKEPEQRYQSAAGLVADLSRMLDAVENGEDVAPFAIGQHDFGERLILPERLYGREAETAALVDALRRSREERGELLLIAGYSGIGKTALVHGLACSLTDDQGIFVSGKFDQLVRGTPYTALRQALGDLTRRILSGPEAAVAEWRAKISEALGTSGQVMVDLIPELETLLGPQTAVPPLGPTETQNRFNRLFREFLEAVADPGHPLVIFLDDVQWIDAASLELLRVALSNGPDAGLLVIAAYRDNEIAPDHPLRAAIAELGDSGTSISQIQLRPLDEAALTEFVADTLRGDSEYGRPVARMLVEKTGGNPFFATQFMKILAQDNCLVPDRDSGRWTYDLERIGQQPSTDNVVELLVNRLQRLPAATGQTLAVAACLGNRFDVRTLALATDTGRQQVEEAVRIGLAEGLILRVGEEFEADRGSTTYAFLHDRVQQAAYALVPPLERPKTHLRIGRALLRELSEEERNERASELVDQVRFGIDLMQPGEESRLVLELAMAAGHSARAAAAYVEALEYFQIAARLLPDDAWSSRYDVAFEVHLRIAEALYLSGRFDEGFVALDGLADRAAGPLDLARVQIRRAAQYETLSDYAASVEALRTGLVSLGIDLPPREQFDEELEAELDAAEEAVAGREIGDLIELPRLRDESVKMCMRLLAFAWAPSYLLADSRMCSWIPARMVRLSLAHGNTEESALGYVLHGFTLGTRRGEYERGHEFGRLGLSLNALLDDLRLRGKVHELFGCFVNQWRRPLSECVESQRTAFKAGIEGGDFAYGSYGGFVETWYALLTREKLAGLEDDYEPVLQFLRSIKNESFVSAEQLILNWAAALRGDTSAPTMLDTPDFSEREFLDGFGKTAFFRVFYDVVKLHLHLLHGNLDDAVEAAEAAESVAHSISGTIWQMLMRFYRSMAIVARRGPRQPLSDDERTQLEEDRALLSVWADNCPENFAHAHLLVEAEAARVEGSHTRAEDLYRRAIDAAQARGFPGDLALANERYGRYWQDRGQTKISTTFLLEALRVYDDWGANPKAEMLAKELSVLIRPSIHPSSDPDRTLASPASVLVTLQSPSEALDFEWAMQAAGALASEIELDRLLELLMQMLLESAGAQRGGLVREREDEPRLRVWGDATTGEISLLDIPLEESNAVPQAVLRYVWRTGERLVVNDAIEDPAYASDPYVRSHQPRSILCLPIRYRSRLVGAVYLENRLHAGVFGRASLHLLETLSAHAAIAIRNAELFDEIAQLEERLRAENVYLQEEIRTHHGFEDIIGESPKLAHVLGQVEQVAGVDTTVLILGETGTGKELLARAIHRLSPRSTGPLVTVNCAAISPGLIESELFGHEKGAFTGATDRKIGRFELAHGGTILLDEIGDLSLDLQVKLLRVLQEGEIQRVGGNRTIPVDVRVIASTHRDLERAQQEGRFRPDLFYRLNVFPIRSPPLRERKEDIPALVRYFLKKDGARLGRQIETIPRRAMSSLESYDWPGNVRELRNVLERSMITSRGSALELGNWLPPEPEESPETEPIRTLDEVQRDYIERVLQNTGWVVSGPNGAAVRLGLKPTTLEARMKKLGLHRPS